MEETMNDVQTLQTGGGFINYMMTLEEENKQQLVNIIQYTCLAIIPVAAVLFVIQRYIPQPDEDKPSLNISLEVIAQLVLMFTSIFFIHKMIVYFPTYSGVPYENINIFNVIIVFLMMILTVHTKLGEMVNILISRLIDLYEGETAMESEERTQVRVTQPLPRDNHNERVNEHLSQKLKSNTITQPTNQNRNFDNMHAHTTTPLVDAHTPGMGLGAVEPMAANAEPMAFSGF